MKFISRALLVAALASISGCAPAIETATSEAMVHVFVMPTEGVRKQ